ncbi:MAG: hypothetical protein K6E99_05970 [Bacilli bacterium]|nr:hypothetical protein [Bacilli bacterium]
MNEVAYYDKTESNLEKSPKTFNDFTYDNEENGGVLNKFSEIGDKIKSIKTDISNLNTEYGNIIKKYEAFSNFETAMNSIVNTMSTRIDNINTCYNNILSTAQQAVKDHVASDKTLIDDLDSINALLAGKTGLEAGLNNTGNNAPLSNKAISDLEFKNSHGGVSQEEWNRMSDSQKQEILKEQAAQEGGKITDQNETAVEDKYSMSSDLDKVADEIIQGKYGNGEDRYAELEKQGYNLRDKYDENGNLIERGVQDIVNEKMNGTYDPNKTPTNTSNEAGYRSTTSSNAEAQAAVNAAQERGKAQTEYYQNQQAQAAVNAAQERGKAQTEYYQNQQEQQAEAAKQQAMANSYSTNYQSPQRMNEAGWGASGTTNYKAPTNNSNSQQSSSNSTPSYSASNYASGNSTSSTGSTYAANYGGSAAPAASTSTSTTQQSSSNSTPSYSASNYASGNSTSSTGSTYAANYGGSAAPAASTSTVGENAIPTQQELVDANAAISSGNSSTSTTSSNESGVYNLPSDPAE